jgi:hypothetical protein
VTGDFTTCFVRQTGESMSNLFFSESKIKIARREARD